MLNDKSILVTGGTGSFGQKFIKTVLENFRPRRVIVYSRDEWKQSEMQKNPDFNCGQVRYFLGDVRDKDRLSLAMRGVDYVVHAAALKQVPAAEYNPHEFIKTNVDGATNIVEASLLAGVQKVVALSTDKAVNPVNLYGATKLCTTGYGFFDNNESRHDAFFDNFEQRSGIRTRMPRGHGRRGAICTKDSCMHRW